MSKLKICRNKGLWLQFDNGITLSIQIGPGNYCDNYDLFLPLASESERRYESTTAELAAWNSKGEWFDFETKEFKDGTDVTNRTPINEVLDWINYFRERKQ